MKYIILAILLLIGLPSIAQNISKNKIGTISGKVIDKLANQPIAYATVIIKDANSKTLDGGITNEKGEFKINKLPEGNLFIEIQFIGFKTYKRSLTITKKRRNFNLNKIPLEEEASQLDEVNIIAETSTVIQKIDRKVINVGKDLISVGSTASEIMNNIPSVSVDQDGNISLRGNQNVRVLVDGKPTSIDAAQLLKQIPSSSIKSIELITNPSAKYNPEGMSGIINIVLHKNSKVGFNGTINTGVTFGRNIRLNSSLDLNYRIGKINLFANYGYNDGKRNNFGVVNRKDNGANTDFIFNNNNSSHLLKTGFDFYINDKNTLSMYTTQNFFDGLGDGSTDIKYTTGAFPNIFQTFNNKSNNNSHAYNLNYKVEFNKEGHNLEFEANYINNDDSSLSNNDVPTNSTNTLLNYRDNISNNRETTILNLDYTNPINDNVKLELGLETRIRNTDNNFNTTREEIDINSNITPVPSIAYMYDRTINSGYVNYQQKIKKFNLQFGARLENYDVKAIQNGLRIYTDNYFTVYPSAFLSYEASDKNQYQASFSRRVDRPGINQVNPIREFSTPQISSFGNPKLNPQFTNSFELNYTRTLKKGSLTFGTFYRRISDKITRNLTPDPVDINKVILSYTNTDGNDAFGVELSSNYRFTKWWKINSSFDLYNQKEQGVVGLENITVTNNAWNLRINNNFKASKNLRFQLFGMYRGANRNLQFDIKSMWKMDVGLRINILKSKGTISARFNDIFNTMRFGFKATNPYPSTGQFHWESQTFRVSFLYNFGSKKNKSRSRKNRNINGGQQGGGFI